MQMMAGPVHQGAGDSDALLLTAGQLAHGLLELFVRQIDLPRDVPNLLINFVLLELLDLEAEGDIIIHSHGREQVRSSGTRYRYFAFRSAHG